MSSKQETIRRLANARKKLRKRSRGVPPPPLFDVYRLADEQLLNAKETAAVVRRAESMLEAWRYHQRDHPLKWRRVAGRIMCTVRGVRAFLRGEGK